jgi:hypothetical protein
MGEQPHGIALAPDLKAIAVVLDLMDPVEPCWRLRGARWDAGRDEAVGANRNHDLRYRLVSPEGNCQSVAELSRDRIDHAQQARSVR